MKRDIGLDYVRCVLALMILLYHFNTLFDAHGISGYHQFIYTFANGYWGAVVVRAFWILSAVCLMKSTERDYNLLQFYKKRVLRLFPVYYVSWVFIFVVKFFMGG